MEASRARDSLGDAQEGSDEDDAWLTGESSPEPRDSELWGSGALPLPSNPGNGRWFCLHTVGFDLYRKLTAGFATCRQIDTFRPVPTKPPITGTVRLRTSGVLDTNWRQGDLVYGTSSVFPDGSAKGSRCDLVDSRGRFVKTKDAGTYERVECWVQAARGPKLPDPDWGYHGVLVRPIKSVVGPSQGNPSNLSQDAVSR